MPEQDVRDYVGLDIGKRQLDYALADAATARVAYTAAGLAQLIAAVRQQPHPCVVCEATGGYERRVVAALGAAGIAVCLVSPGRVRAFARAQGLLAKTDPIDARLLRQFGQTLHPRVYTPLPRAAAELRALLEYRGLLVAQLAELPSRHEVAGETLRPLLLEHQSRLHEALAGIETRLRTQLQTQPELSAKALRLQQVTGVGVILAASLLAYVPELGQISDKSLSALVGVAPHPHDSAASSRPRHVRGGRAAIRRVLYMSAVCAARFNPRLRAFYLRLRAAGKPAMVAVVAVMRKLLCLLNRLIADPDFVLAS